MYVFDFEDSYDVYSWVGTDSFEESELSSEDFSGEEYPPLHLKSSDRTRTKPKTFRFDLLAPDVKKYIIELCTYILPIRTVISYNILSQ